MRKKNLFITGTILLTALALGGCQKKKVDECADPNCVDPKCATTDQKAFTTKRVLEPQTICPIMGAPIDKSIYVDKDSLRIYVSEESAKKELSANFNKYVEELKGMGQKPDIAQ